MQQGQPSGAAPAGPHRRGHPRARFLTQVETQGSGRTILGSAEDISVGGLRILTAETLLAGTEVLVRFNLPSILERRLVETKGVVVHSQPGLHMGIQFQELKEDELDAIEKYVQQAGGDLGL